MPTEERLIGLVVSLVALCGLLIRFVLKGKTKPDTNEDSAKRLARLQVLQAREREQRMHQHFKDYHEFADATRRSLADLGFRASEMEKDVAELKERFREELKNSTESRVEILQKLSRMEGAARAFASYAQDARRTLGVPILTPDPEV